jgi:hypothetical protein
MNVKHYIIPLLSTILKKDDLTENEDSKRLMSLHHQSDKSFPKVYFAWNLIFSRSLSRLLAIRLGKTVRILILKMTSINPSFLYEIPLSMANSTIVSHFEW